MTKVQPSCSRELCKLDTRAVGRPSQTEANVEGSWPEPNLRRAVCSRQARGKEEELPKPFGTHKNLGPRCQTLSHRFLELHC